MFSIAKPSFTFVAAASLLWVATASTAHADNPVQWGTFDASSNDRITASSWAGANRYELHSSAFTIGELEQMRDAQKRDSAELQSLKNKMQEQARALEDLSKHTGSRSSTSDSQLSDLKRTVADQKSLIDKLKSELDELKRNASSSSSSSSGDVSGLKRTVADQNSSLDKLRSQVEDLKRNSSSSSSSSSSELSGLKGDVSNQKRSLEDQKRSLDDQKRSLDDLKRSVDTLSSKVK